MTSQLKNTESPLFISNFNLPLAMNKHLLLGLNVEESTMLGKRNPFPRTRNLEKISSHINCKFYVNYFSLWKGDSVCVYLFFIQWLICMIILYFEFSNITLNCSFNMESLYTKISMTAQLNGLILMPAKFWLWVYTMLIQI